MRTRKIKFKSLFTVLLAIIICLSFSISSVSAASSTSGSSSSSSSTSESDKDGEKDTEEDTDDNKDDENEEDSDYSWSSNTIGNSELVADEDILMENGSYQFIAVTTRDEDVFYVIIDKTKTEDNVYFLNEVDTYDINKLVNDDENGSSEDGNIDVEETEPEEATVAAQTTSSSSGNSQFMLYLIIGIVILGGIGFALFKLKKGKKKDTSQEDDFDFDDEYEEINEDKEGNK